MPTNCSKIAVEAPEFSKNEFPFIPYFVPFCQTITGTDTLYPPPQKSDIISFIAHDSYTLGFQSIACSISLPEYLG